MSGGETPDAARWRLLTESFGELVELAADECGARLREIRHADPAFADALARLLAADRTGRDLLDRPLALAPQNDEAEPLPAEPPPAHAGAYRVLDLLGRGGMADVFAGERDDGTFAQRVAVKILRRGLDTDDLVARFVRERQILARLEHPAIARLLDGGALADGRPYLVMERVDGLPLHQFAVQHALSVEQRLAILLSICDAVSYAHRNLVVHRDLKPSNVLVTPDGEVKLLDFGIAKLLEPGGGGLATERGVQIMTPSYAAPEQLSGAPTTTATDVWGLGALAYALLVGEAPREPRSSVASAPFAPTTPTFPTRPSRKVRERSAADSQSLRLAERLEGDLDAIVTRALADLPERRYPTAEAFADDIRRHLDGRPVAARPDTVRYRLSRFLHRHRLAVAAAALAAAALTVALVAVLWQARVAERERARTQRRFDDVRGLSEALLHDVHDQVAALPGSLSVRKAILEHATHYLETLSKDVAADRALAMELARSWARVGDLQGGPHVANLGDLDGADRSYARADRVIAEATAAPGAVDAEVLQLRAGLALSRARVATAQGRAADAEAHYRLALPLAEEGARLGAGSLKSERQRLVIAVDFANLLVKAKPAEALQAHARAKEIARELVARFPNEKEANRDFSIILLTSLYDHVQLGELDAALAETGPALARAEKLVATWPDDPQLKRDRNFVLSLQAHAFRQLGRFAEARPALDALLAALEQRLAAEPADAQSVRDLAEELNERAELHLLEHQPEGALLCLARGESLLSGLLARDPDSLDNRTIALGRLASEASAYHLSGDTTKARQRARAALRAAASLEKDGGARTLGRDRFRAAAEVALLAPALDPERCSALTAAAASGHTLPEATSDRLLIDTVAALEAARKRLACR
ncbi:MAG: serine/threonine-protein kinase [Thermoanaerobaculia bacterium]